MKKLRWEEVLRVNPTKGNLAVQYNLKSYDVALPQDWLDRSAVLLADRSELTRDQAYDKILFGTVWNYPEKSIFGEPFYLYQELEEVMCEL